MPSPRRASRAVNADLLARLIGEPPEVRRAALAALPEENRLRLRYLWPFWARPQQMPPAGDWLVWLVLSGRGWGKTRVGAEFIRHFCVTHPGSRAALVAATFADGRDAMVEGESGLLSITAPSEMRGGTGETAWNRSLGEFFFSNGSRAKIYSSEKPGQLRGPQSHVAWCDEAAKFGDAMLGTQEDTTWSRPDDGPAPGLPSALRRDHDAQAQPLDQAGDFKADDDRHARLDLRQP